MIDFGQLSTEVLAAVVAVQHKFIESTDLRTAFECALSEFTALSESKLGLIAELPSSVGNSPSRRTHVTFGAENVSAGSHRSNGAAGEAVHSALGKFVDEAIHSGAAAFSNSPAGDSNASRAGTGRLPIENYLCLPCCARDGRVVGMVGLANRALGYVPEHIALLQPLCDALGVIADASQRKLHRVEASVSGRASEIRFQALIDHVTDGLFLHDEYGYIIDANRRAYESLGYTRDELIGMHPTEFDPAISTAQLKDNLRRLTAGESITFDSWHQRKDGSKFPVEVRIRPVVSDGKTYLLALACDITERKRAEERLQEQSAILQAILEHTTDFVYLKDSAGRYLTINSAAAAYVGKTTAEIVGRDDRAIFPAAVARDIMQREQEIMRDGKSQRFDEMIPSGNETRYLSTAKNVCRDSTGKVIGLVGITRDITDLKRAVRALSDAQQRLALILKGADVGLWDWDLRTNDVNFSAEWKHQLGYGEHEILNRYEDWAHRVHPDDLPGALEKVKHTLETCTADYSSEFRMRHKNGSWRWILALGCVVVDEAGQAARLMGVHIDITERKRVEEALQASESRYRTFVDHVSDAMFLQDSAGNITDVNRQACVSLGLERHELIGMSPPEFDPDVDMTFVAECQRRLDAGETVIFESHHRRRDGTSFPVEVRLRPFWENEQRQCIALVRNISDKKRAEDELAARQAELLHASRLATLGQMVAALSHEVAQPLSAIGNFAAACDRILESRNVDQRTLHEYVRTIAQQNERCTAILDRLRDFSRPTATRNVCCDLTALLRESVALIASELRQNGIRIHYELATTSPQVTGDRIQLQQVIVNLLTNARDAVCDMPQERRTVTVRSLVDDGAAVFEIEDLGNGLSADMAAHLFDPFFTTKPHGMGIGLSISQSIVNRHGGQVDAYANTHGGTTFRVRLPIT